MSEAKIYDVPAAWASRAWVDANTYASMYRRSVDDPAGFWGEHGKGIDWIKPYTKVKDTSFGPGDVWIKWYEDGTLNVSANCIDRHLASRGDQIAIIWEGDDPTQDERITYRPAKRLEEPFNPLCNIEVALLSALKNRIVASSFSLNL